MLNRQWCLHCFPTKSDVMNRDNDVYTVFPPKVMSWTGLHTKNSIIFYTKYLNGDMKMHCEGLSQCSNICVLFLFISRKLIVSQCEQQSAYLKDVMFSIRKHYAKIGAEARRDYEDICKQIKKKVLVLLCLYLFIWQMLLSKMT